MLNLAILALVVLVASALWLLLRPPAPLAAERNVPDDTSSVEGSDPAKPSDHADMHTAAPPQSDEHASDR